MIEQFYLTDTCYANWSQSRCKCVESNGDDFQYSAFSKAPVPEPPHQIKFSVIPWKLGGVGSYPSAEEHSTYSTVSADRVGFIHLILISL